jgi:hypothetical protein
VNGKYVVVTWRYGQCNEFEFDTYDEALSFFEAGVDHFAEFLKDPSGNVLRDGKKNVIGYRGPYEL